MRRTQWTSEQSDQAKAMVAEGRTANEVAEMIGRTPMAVRGHLFRAGIFIDRVPHVKKEKKPFSFKAITFKTKFVMPESKHEKLKPTAWLMKAKERQCRWIEDVAGIETRICGRETITGKSYCTHHHAIAFVKKR
jgi:hypothetical protein